MSVYLRRYVIGKMLFDPITNTYTDLKDGQQLAKKMTTEQEQPKNVFKELFRIDLEASRTVSEFSSVTQVSISFCFPWHDFAQVQQSE